MKDEVFAVLSNFDNYFITATEADFIRSLTVKELNDLIGAAKEVGIFYTNNHCPKCTLDFIKKLAVPYFKEKAARQEAAKKREELSKDKAKKQSKSNKGDGREEQQSQENIGQTPDEA